MPFAYNRNYKNMTEQQADQREQERVRVMLFGRNLISDRIIGRWSDGITGEELVKHLYGNPPPPMAVFTHYQVVGDYDAAAIRRYNIANSGLVGDTIAENVVEKSRSIQTPETSMGAIDSNLAYSPRKRWF